MLFGYTSFWIAAIGGTGENDVGLAGSRPMLVAWSVTAVGVGVAGVALAMTAIGRKAKTLMLLLGAIPPLFFIVVITASWVMGE